MSGLEISEEGREVLEGIFKQQEANHKMIDSWKHRWLLDEVSKAEDLISHINEAFQALYRLEDVGISLNGVETALYKMRRTTKEIMQNAKMKLETHEKVFGED
jgi:hypothetical protein